MAAIKIEEATADQLRQFAETVLGITNLSTNPNTRAETLITRIREAGYQKATIEVADAPVSPSGTAPANPNVDEAEKMAAAGQVKIHIHSAPEGESNDDVFVSVNGRGILLPRGKDIRVKPAVVEVLSHAKRLVYPQQSEGGLGEPREVAQYPFSVVA